MREIEEMQHFLDELDEPVIYGEQTNEYQFRDSLPLPIATETPEHRQYIPIPEELHHDEEVGQQVLYKAQNLLRSLRPQDIQKSIEHELTFDDANKQINDVYDQITDSYAPLKERSVMFEKSNDVVDGFDDEEEAGLPAYPVNSKFNIVIC
jgi:hypothetical protein